MKREIFILILFMFIVISGNDEVFANSNITKNDSYIKVMKDSQIYVIDEYIYQENHRVFVPLDLVTNQNYFSNEFILYGSNFLKSKKIKEIEDKYYIDLNSYNQVSNIYINYNETYGFLYVGEVLSDDDIVNKVLSSMNYSRDDFLWLSKIIYAEARGENYDSKLGVGNVIKNRVASSSYPNTIKGVVLDRKHGVQFSPVLDGAINNNSNDDCRAVAIDVLLGINNAEDALFFMNPDIAETTWISRNRTYLTSYGNHAFYL